MSIDSASLQPQSQGNTTGDHNDSDTDLENDLEDSEDEMGHEDNDGDQPIAQWTLNTPFEGTDSRKKFATEFSRRDTRSNQGLGRIGLQASINSVNSPIKAWRHIFTDGILNKVVRYSNAYGDEHCPKWEDITKRDLTYFIAVLFIVSVQKRKDKSKNWSANDPLVENIPVKKVMTGNKFHRILRYPKVCDHHAQPMPEDESYTPMYKVNEFKADLEHRFNISYIPAYGLSLDDTLIRSFGRIKFKVRITTKSARYGIKVYVVTDAASAYVLKVIFYTGKYTYHATPDDEALKNS